jgi:PAS domain S-box-containing protein
VPALVGATVFGEGRGLGFVLDLTEQKRAEAAIRERDALVRGLVDANIIGTFTWRRDKAGGAGFRPVFQDVNDAFLRIVGYDREDLAPGTSTWILTPPDWVDRTQRAADEMQLNGAFQPYEKVFLRKDGSRVPVLVGAAQTGDTGIAFVIDLTEQKRVEAALRKSEEQWKAVFENNPIMYFMVGETGTILSVNPFGAEQLGYTADELTGRPVTTVFYEEDRATVQRNAATCFEQPGQAMSWELRKVRKDGEVIWVRETARASMINNRLVLLIVCEDITESKRVGEALREAQFQLAHANRVAAMGQLTASIAHEVRQPLAAVKMSGNTALRWLTKSPPEIEEAKLSIESIVSDTNRANDVISRIHSLVRKATPSKDAVDINEAILEVIALTRAEAVKQSVTVQIKLADNLPCIRGDRVQLQQVVINLIINAIQAMSSVAESARELHISTVYNASEGVRVSVRDTGPGIGTEDMPHLFEPFYTTKPRGMGMGLSICRSIVEDHGGRLWASEHEPKGALLQFTIPVG